ncbi:hypothetical protein M8J75_006467 [Diaphorina citri]|nr:hypothetical protein M8J75_006467 [Diaphorina citri]KAI5754548.1 hypothetical protein M8J77_009458 [Diaphorina citri]
MFRSRRIPSSDSEDDRLSSYGSQDSTYSCYSFHSNFSLDSNDCRLINTMRCVVPQCNKILPKAYCNRMDILCKYHAQDYEACPQCASSIKRFDGDQLKDLKQYCDLLFKAGIIDRHGNIKGV